ECDRALFELALLLPNRRASLEILAGPAFAVRIAVDVIAHFHDAAMMIHHNFVGIDLRGGERTSFGHSKQVAARAVAGRDIDFALGINRRRNHGRLASAGCLPKNLTVFWRYPSDALVSKLDVLADTLNLCNYHRGIVSVVCPLLA